MQHARVSSKKNNRSVNVGYTSAIWRGFVIQNLYGIVRVVRKKTVFVRSGSVHTKLLCNATKIMMTIARRGKRNNWITQKYNLLSLTWFNPTVYNNLTYFLKRNFAGTNQKLVILLLYESYIKLIIVESNTDLLERVSFWRFWRGSPYHVFPHPKFS